MYHYSNTTAAAAAAAAEGFLVSAMMQFSLKFSPAAFLSSLEWMMMITGVVMSKQTPQCFVFWHV